MQALGIGGTVAAAGCTAGSNLEATEVEQDIQKAAERSADRVAAPIDLDEPKHHDIVLSAEEVTAEIEEETTFSFLTYEGQIPGPIDGADSLYERLRVTTWIRR